MKKLLFILLLCAGTSTYAVPVIDLALCLDSSGSISPADYQLQLDGTAAAIENPAIIPQDGSVRITVLQFGTAVSTAVPPTDITAANAAAVAATVRAMGKDDGGTNMSGCITAATAAITGASPVTAKRVIDISTDGEPNSLFDTNIAAAAAQAAGIDALNALLVGPGPNVPFMDLLVFPQPNGGSDGFAILIPDFASYETAIASKIQAEVIPPPPPPAPDAIPTLSEWGLFILAFLLVLASWGSVGRKKRS